MENGKNNDNTRSVNPIGDFSGIGNLLGGLGKILGMGGNSNSNGSNRGMNPLGNIGKLLGINNQKNANNTQNRCTVKVLHIEEAYKKIKMGAVCLIDVRTEMEYSTIRIKGSMNIPLDRLQQEILLKVPNRSTEIIIYCATGSRVRRAMQILWSLGYNNLWIWEGAGLNTFAFQDLIIYNNDTRKKGDETNGASKQQ